jgi:hypothetical protein
MVCLDFVRRQGSFVFLARHWAIALGIAALPPAIANAEPLTTPSPDYFRAWELTDAYLPAITLRKLSSEEKKSIPALAAEFEAQGRFSTLLQLFRLGESGNKDAMMAVIRVLSNYAKLTDVGGELKPSSEAGLQGANTPISIWARNLRGNWAARYWQMHGSDRLAAQAMEYCKATADDARAASVPAAYPPNTREFISIVQRDGAVDCGFSVYFNNKNNDMKIVFYPISTDIRTNEGRVNVDLDTVGSPGYGTQLNIDEENWLINYLAKIGRLGEYHAKVRESKDFPERFAAAGRKLVAEMEANIMADKARREARWNALWDKPSITLSEQEELVRSAIQLDSGAYGRHAGSVEQRFGISWDGAALQSFCQKGSPHHCNLSRQQMYQQKFDQQYREAAATAIGRGGSASVTLRTYDRNGNYVGSTTTTRTEAELLGAKPQ